MEKEQPPMPTCTPGHVVDHIEHIIEVAGIDHVGLGSDYDGISYGPDQMPDVSGFPYITQVLCDRGYGEEEIGKILGGNFLRVLSAAEERKTERKYDHGSTGKSSGNLKDQSRLPKTFSRSGVMRAETFVLIFFSSSCTFRNIPSRALFVR